MQLILAGVFHIDVPPGNIALADVQALAGKPQVAKLIPLSLGDSFRGFPASSAPRPTTCALPRQLAQGRLWSASMEAVLGAEAARPPAWPRRAASSATTAWAAAATRTATRLTASPACWRPAAACWTG